MGNIINFPYKGLSAKYEKNFQHNLLNILTEGESFYTCSCGNSLFFITMTGNKCQNCGMYVEMENTDE